MPLPKKCSPSAGSSVASPGPGDAGKFLAVNDAENGYELVAAPSGGGGSAPVALFEFHHQGDNNSPTIGFQASEAFNTPPGPMIATKAMTTLVFNAPEGGTFTIRRLSSLSEPGVILHYSEVTVSSLDGTAQIIANPAEGPVETPVEGALTDIPLVNSWDAVGTDLTLDTDTGRILTAAGGTFLVTVTLMVEVTDPS